MVSFVCNESFLVANHLAAIQVMRLLRPTGIFLTTKDVLAGPTVKQLAHLSSQSKITNSPTAVLQKSWDLKSLDRSHLPQEDVMECVLPCTPLQQYMFHAFHKNHRRPYVFNTLVELNTADLGESGPNGLLEAWKRTVERHAILRTVFVLQPSSNDVFQVVLKSDKHQADASMVAIDCEDEVVSKSKSHLTETRKWILKSHKTSLISLRLFITRDNRVWAHFIIGHLVIDHVR